MDSVAGVVSSDVRVCSCWTPCYTVALLLSLNLICLVCVVQRKMHLLLYRSILESLFSYLASMKVNHVEKTKKRKPLIKRQSS